MAPALAARASEQRIESLDLLRGLAAFAVVLFHVRVTMWVGLRALMADAAYPALDRALALATLPFPLFGSAVMLFFIVSGFAIHYPYAGRGDDFALAPYLTRRFFRIYPAYLAVIALTAAAEFAGARGAQWAVSSWPKVWSTMAMTQNYVSPAGQMVGNPSLWSLPVEVELYLVYPVLLVLRRAVGTTCAILFVAALSAAAAVALGAGHEWPMGNFAKYWILWVSGAALAEAVRTDRLPQWRRAYGHVVAGFLLLAVACRVASVPVGIEHFVWGGVYFGVVLWTLNRPQLLLHLAPGVRRTGLFLGRISYSLYLVHFPIFVALGAGWMAVFGHKPVNVLVPLTASLIPIPAAYVLWRWVERPSQSLGRQLSQSSTSPLAPPATAGVA